MYQVTIRAKSIHNGETAQHEIESAIPLAINDVREKLLANGWLTIGIWNDIKH